MSKFKKTEIEMPAAPVKRTYRVVAEMILRSREDDSQNLRRGTELDLTAEEFAAFGGPGALLDVVAEAEAVALATAAPIVADEANNIEAATVKNAFAAGRVDSVAAALSLARRTLADNQKRVDHFEKLLAAAPVVEEPVRDMTPVRCVVACEKYGGTRVNGVLVPQAVFGDSITVTRHEFNQAPGALIDLDAVKAEPVPTYPTAPAPAQMFDPDTFRAGLQRDRQWAQGVLVSRDAQARAEAAKYAAAVTAGIPVEVKS